jgi:hypothetical protein
MIAAALGALVSIVVYGGYLEDCFALGFSLSPLGARSVELSAYCWAVEKFAQHDSEAIPSVSIP